MLDWKTDLKRLPDLSNTDLNSELPYFNSLVIFNNILNSLFLVSLFIIPFISTEYVYPTQLNFFIASFFAVIFFIFIIGSITRESGRGLRDSDKLANSIKLGKLADFINGFQASKYFSKDFYHIFIFPFYILAIFITPMLYLIDKEPNGILFFLFGVSYLLVVFSRSISILLSKNSLLVFSILYLVILIVPYFLGKSLINDYYKNILVTYAPIVGLYIANIIQRLKNKETQKE
jgi:hypothetical protein